MGAETEPILEILVVYFKSERRKGTLPLELVVVVERQPEVNLEINPNQLLLLIVRTNLELYFSNKVLKSITTHTKHTHL